MTPSWKLQGLMLGPVHTHQNHRALTLAPSLVVREGRTLTQGNLKSTTPLQRGRKLTTTNYYYTSAFVAKYRPCLFFGKTRLAIVEFNYKIKGHTLSTHTNMRMGAGVHPNACRQISARGKMPCLLTKQSGHFCTFPFLQSLFSHLIPEFIAR